MRLVVRSNSHRVVEDGVTEVAASPDTPRRELWQWQVRVLETDRVTTPDHSTASRVTAPLARGNGATSLVEVSADPEWAVPTVESIEMDGPHRIERDLNEVVAIVVGRGQVRIEGRHVLREMDVFVLEGDDPFTVAVDRPTDEVASITIARVHGAGSRALGWVP